MNSNSFSFFSSSTFTPSTSSQGLISFLNTFDTPLEALDDKPKDLTLRNDNLLLEEELLEDYLLLLSDPLLTRALLLESNLHHKLNLNLNLNLEDHLHLEGDLLGSWLTPGRLQAAPWQTLELMADLIKTPN